MAMNVAEQKPKATLLLLPAIFLFLVLYVYPLGGLLSTSVYDDGFTDRYYAEFFGEPAYLKVLGRTVQVAFSVTVLTLLLSYPLAFVLATARGRVTNLLIAVILFPFWISVLVRTYAWMVLQRARQEARFEETMTQEARAAGARMEAIVVLEVVGMTDLLITHGDEAFKKFSERIANQLNKIAKEFRARAIERHLDGFLMTFPNVDWAVLTIRSIFNRLSEFNELSEMEVAFRGALHYGSTWVDPHSNRVGAAVHKAFRVCAAIGTPDVWGPGRPKEKNVVVATEETREMLLPYNVSARPLGSIPLKGFDGLHPVYELAVGLGA